MIEYPKILVAILARDKEATLPLYLKCLENIDYDKKRMVLYICTNDNSDNTEQILVDFISNNKDKYATIEFHNENVGIELSRHHEWNVERFKILGHIRNMSMQATLKYGCSFYWVSDVDNFCFPHTLKSLVSYNLPIVAPLLSNDQSTLYANFHYDVDANGYYKDNQSYFDIFSRTIKGIIEVKVVHCTYLIRADVIPLLTYDDESCRYEYVIFSDSARKNNIPQYIDNTQRYGIITFNTKVEEMENFEQKYLIGV